MSLFSTTVFLIAVLINPGFSNRCGVAQAKEKMVEIVGDGKSPLLTATSTVGGGATLKISAFGLLEFTGGGVAGYDKNFKNFSLSTYSNDLYLATDYMGKGNHNIILKPNGTGKVGIGLLQPQATLDVDGFAKLKVNSAEPVACSAMTAGSIAVSSKSTICVCKGSTKSWVLAGDGKGTCAWK